MPQSTDSKELRESSSWVKRTRTVESYLFIIVSFWFRKGIFGRDLRGSWLSTIRCPAIAQSIVPDCLSTRRSTYQFFTDRTRVSVFSNGGSGGHRRERRVERRDSDIELDWFGC